jgi:type I restriction enzyme, S subunit
MPRGWASTTVGEVAALTDGPFGSNLKTAHYVSEGPRVIRLQNIGAGAFRDERAHITIEHFETLRKHEVLPGDVVVASLGEEAPRACLVPPSLGPAVVKADCIRLRAADGIEPAFLMWILNSPPVKAQASRLIKGVGRPRLGLGGIRGLAPWSSPPSLRLSRRATSAHRRRKRRAG